ncbi:tetratricopeptide repeat protein [Thioalkalivibrio sp. XN8]|uniref:tetratricopeptide repeat protein n=1 Tax=Thioalkalivibrio sp. XN8 TaxID=2712863 RepID=UPI0013EAC507|nr:tetratricopeptide repeat protein [Thioalkalivibrio sp. XN8]NGP54116.1 tetratricopeptide repeat protein [Thioalkalivibrio sp. XN8]
MSLWAELKRRKVVRVAVVYAATSFALLEAADLMLPRLGVPDWSMNLIVGLVILGFPIALIMGWALELTPEGVKRTDELPEPTAPEAAPALLGKRTVFLAALLVAVGVGLGAGWFLKPAGEEPGEAPFPTAATTAADDAAPPATTTAAADKADQPDKNTIAVLPFVNMSANPENVFFAEGIAEELLNILAGVDGLKVASRTSAFSFRGKDTPIPEIARELGVRHILEGSVRRQGDRVRITAQLIETDSDTHLWSETFERDLVDIFRVQEEIAQAITLALKDVLGVRQVSVAATTTDLTAYELFLRGRTRFYQRFGLDEAIADLQSAVERDPDFAEAWAFLGAASFVVGNGGYPTELDRARLMDEARLAVERALVLDPELATAMAVKGQLLTLNRDPAQIVEGLQLLERAASRVTADSSAPLWLGLSLLELGRVDRALPHLEKANALDPLVGINQGYLGIAYVTAGRAEEAILLGLRSQELTGSVFWSFQMLIELVNSGAEARAYELLGAMLAADDLNPVDRQFFTELQLAISDPAQRDSVFVSGEPGADGVDRFRAVVKDLMFRNGARAISMGDLRVSQLMLTIGAWLPSLGWLREDPALYAYMDRIGTVGFWELDGFPPGCRPVDDPAGRRLDCSGYGP